MATMPNERRASDPRFAAEFGPHARAAEQEFTRPAAATFVVVSDRSADADLAGAPANSNTAPAQRSAPQAGQADRIDVVLERQTATVSLPREGLETSTLLNEQLQGVLVRLDEGAKKISGRVEGAQAVQPALLASSDAALSPFRAIPEEISDVEEVEGEIESDASIADAVAIAGRLRPRVAGE